MCTNHSLLNRTVELAEGGRWKTFPNPMVGALIESDGRIISTGFHHAYGDLHAEADALRNAGPSARGATVYCNLEPCSYTSPEKHQPACTDLLVEAGVSKVVIGQLDPNPKVRGRGVEKLRNSGVEVVTDSDPERFWRFNDAFNTFMALSRPFIHLKVAMTLDGRIATDSGDSKWITDEAARREVHSLRAEREGLLVGIGTVLADDPSLTVRLVSGRSPRPVVLDSDLRIPLHSRLVRERASQLILCAATPPAEDFGFTSRRRRLEKLGVTVILTSSSNGRVNLPEALAAVRGKEVRSLLVEGGSAVVTALLSAGLYDRITAYLAPRIIGSGISGIGDLGIESVADALDFEAVQWRSIGNQQVFDAYRDGWYESVTARIKEDHHVYRTC